MVDEDAWVACPKIAVDFFTGEREPCSLRKGHRGKHRHVKPAQTWTWIPPMLVYFEPYEH